MSPGTQTDPAAGLVDPTVLRERLGQSAAGELEEMLTEVRCDPTRIGRLLPAAARRTARGTLTGVPGPVTLEDAVRVELVMAFAGAVEDTALDAELAALYRFGDNDEKRAVLLAVHLLADRVSPQAMLLDALRTNDPRLVRAALGPQAARLLDDEQWRQGVLKALFTGVELSSVAGLSERTDDELARIAARYAHERVAAGRDVPADVWLVLDGHDEAIEESGVRAELDSPHDDRRAAAERFLAARPTGTTAAGQEA